MNHAHLVPRALIALAGLVGSFGCGCSNPLIGQTSAAAPSGEGALFDGRGAYDHQACAENSLRRGNAIVAGMEQQVQSACRGGDQASCSMLGVMYELGRGMPLQRERARALYQWACNQGNARACGNLGELLIADDAGKPSEMARMLLRKSCDGGQGRACAVLARIQTHPGVARAFFERACEQGDGPGCYELAIQLETSFRVDDNIRATELLATACTRGESQACEHLVKTAPPHEAPPRPAVATDHRSP